MKTLEINFKRIPNNCDYVAKENGELLEVCPSGIEDYFNINSKQPITVVISTKKTKDSYKVKVSSKNDWSIGDITFLDIKEHCPKINYIYDNLREYVYKVRPELKDRAFYVSVLQ